MKPTLGDRYLDLNLSVDSPVNLLLWVRLRGIGMLDTKSFFKTLCIVDYLKLLNFPLDTLCQIQLPYEQMCVQRVEKLVPQADCLTLVLLPV